VTDFKAWGEHVAVSETFAFKMPTSMSYEEGAALFMNYVTAYILLFELGNIRANQSVLVHSAGGGVVSINVLLGARLLERSVIVVL